MNKYIIATLFTLFLSATCYHSSEEEIFIVEFLLGEVEVHLLPSFVKGEVVVSNAEVTIEIMEDCGCNEEEDALHNAELLVDIVEDCVFNEEVIPNIDVPVDIVEDHLSSEETIPNIDVPVDVVEDSLFLSAAGEEEEGFSAEFLLGNVESWFGEENSEELVLVPVVFEEVVCPIAIFVSGCTSEEEKFSVPLGIEEEGNGSLNDNVVGHNEGHVRRESLGFLSAMNI